MLSNAAEVTSLFGNIREIFGFQQKFLAALEEAVDAEPAFHQLDALEQFKVRATSRGAPRGKESVAKLERIFSIRFSTRVTLSNFLLRQRAIKKREKKAM